MSVPTEEENKPRVPGIPQLEQPLRWQTWQLLESSAKSCAGCGGHTCLCLCCSKPLHARAHVLPVLQCAPAQLGRGACMSATLICRIQTPEHREGQRTHHSVENRSHRDPSGRAQARWSRGYQGTQTNENWVKTTDPHIPNRYCFSWNHQGARLRAEQPGCCRFAVRKTKTYSTPTSWRDQGRIVSEDGLDFAFI